MSSPPGTRSAREKPRNLAIIVVNSDNFALKPTKIRADIIGREESSFGRFRQRVQTMRTAEERRKLIVSIVGYTTICLLVLLTLTVTLGDRFFGLMSFLGLDRFKNNPGWMYVDCAKEENRSLKFCQPKETAVDQSWKTIKRSGASYVPFGLSPEKWEK